MILRDGDERLTLNMRHDTSSYSNNPKKESIYMIHIYNVSHEKILEDLFAINHLSGNPTSSLTSHTDLTSPEVNDDIFDPKGDIIKNLLNLDKTKDLPLYHDNPLSDSTTSSSPSLLISESSDYFLEEFANELALITFPPGNDDLPLFSKIRLIKILMMKILLIPFLRCSPMNMLLITHPHHYGMIMMMNFLILIPLMMILRMILFTPRKRKSKILKS
ncbi:hypothetical protein Tco_1580842 [Tanacetum coccineum]